MVFMWDSVVYVPVQKLKMQPVRLVDWCVCQVSVRGRKIDGWPFAFHLCAEV